MLHSLANFIEHYGYIAVALLVAAEGMGVPLPGETAVVTAAAFAGRGSLSLLGVIISATIGAAVGGTGGYALGLWGGRTALLRYGRWVGIDEVKVAQAEDYFSRHGAKTVFFARFVALLRILGGLMAGAMRMSFLKFSIANVTGGALPFRGTGTVVFLGPTGENSVTGKFTLPKNNIVVSGKLSLDSSSNVSGAVDVVESGATLHITNISGSLSSDLTGSISCDPYGWKGTGVFNLQTGKFSITLTTGTGTATASSDTSGSLILHFADGTTQTITSPLTSNLAGVDTGSGSGSGSGSGGTGGTGSVAYNAPVLLVLPKGATNLANADAITSANIAIGEIATEAGLYSTAWTSPTNAAILPPLSGTSNTITVATAGNTTQIVGGFGESIYYYTPALWSGASYTPQALQKTALPVGLATSINAAGQIVGVAGTAASNGHNRITFRLAIFDDAQALYWANATAAPTVLTPLVAGSSAEAVSINSKGQIVGYAFNAAGKLVPVYWSSPTATPTALTLPSGATSVNVAGIDNSGHIAGTSSTGTDLNTASGVPLFWSTPTASPTALPLPTGATDGVVNGLSGNGLIVGAITTASGTHAAVWKNQQIEDLTDTLPTNSTILLQIAQAVNDQGQILVFGIGDTNAYFTLTPK